MAGNIGMKLKSVFGKVNHVPPNFVLSTFNINSIGAYAYQSMWHVFNITCINKGVNWPMV